MSTSQLFDRVCDHVDGITAGGLLPGGTIQRGVGQVAARTLRAWRQRGWVRLAGEHHLLTLEGYQAWERRAPKPPTASELDAAASMAVYDAERLTAADAAADRAYEAAVRAAIVDELARRKAAQSEGPRTQADLAVALGMSEPSLSRTLRRGVPEPATRAAIQAAIGFHFAAFDAAYRAESPAYGMRQPPPSRCRLTPSSGTSTGHSRSTAQ